MKRKIFVGSYAPAGAPGIQILELDEETGLLSDLHTCSIVECPSYLALSPDEKTLYAVSETTVGGSIYAFTIAADGNLFLQGHMPTSGGAACHLAVDLKGQFLLVSNYGSGILDMFRLTACGGLAEHACALQFFGSGPDLRRQEQAHAHFSTFVPEGISRLAAVDLGSDRLWLLEWKQESGRLVLKGSVSLPAGYGPRHLVFSPRHSNLAYVICELGLRVLSVQVNERDGKVIQDQSCVPENAVLEAGAGAIKLSEDGRFVYASTRVYHADRGTDCIACYAVEEESGKLGEPIFYELDGRVPRDILLTENYLLAACQESDCILVLPRNQETGELLSAVQRYPLYRPSCVIHAWGGR